MIGTEPDMLMQVFGSQDGGTEPRGQNAWTARRDDKQLTICACVVFRTV